MMTKLKSKLNVVSPLPEQKTKYETMNQPSSKQSLNLNKGSLEKNKSNKDKDLVQTKKRKKNSSSPKKGRTRSTSSKRTLITDNKSVNDDISKNTDDVTQKTEHKDVVKDAPKRNLMQKSRMKGNWKGRNANDKKLKQLEKKKPRVK